MDTSKKLKLFLKIILEQPIDKIEFNYFKNFQEIIDLINDKYNYNKKKYFTKIIYFNKNCVHNILYECEEMINISNQIDEISLSYNYILVLLIDESPNLVNYTYSLDYIKEIYIYIKNNNKSILKKIIFSLIILELINNYNNFDDEDNREKKNTLDRITIESINFIEDNLKNLKKYNLMLNLKDYKSNRLDVIYAQILKQLIENNNFEDYQFIYNIIKDMYLENIDINNFLFEELRKVLNNENNNINNKKIMSQKDFNKINIINFYYILLKFILKNSIYIYNIPFLLETRIKILRIIKSSNRIVLNDNKNFKEYREKLYYIIEILTDSKYYFILFKNKVSTDIENEKNNECEKPTDEFSSDIKDEKNNVNNCCPLIQDEITKQNSKMTNLTKNMILDCKNKKIKDSFSFKYDYSNCKIDENIIKNNIKKNNYNEEENSCLNLRKILKFIYSFDEKLHFEFKTNFNENHNLYIELNFENTNKKNKNNTYIINCIYNIEKLNTTYKDENILVNGLSDGFQTLLCDIKYELI